MAIFLGLAFSATSAVYSISVAADLVGNEPQNLRLYEARGLVTSGPPWATVRPSHADHRGTDRRQR